MQCAVSERAYKQWLKVKQRKRRGALKAEEAAIFNKVIGEGLDGKVTTESESEKVGVSTRRWVRDSTLGRGWSGAAGVCKGRRLARPEPRAGGIAQGEVRGPGL